MKAIYFYHRDGKFLGSAIEGPAADRYETELKGKYGKDNILTLQFMPYNGRRRS